MFASSTGDRQGAVVDAGSLRILARLGPIGYADGLAYAPDARRVFVSDEFGAGRELVIPHAHTVAVDPATHLVYLPIERLGSRPVLEIYQPKEGSGK